MLFRSSLSTGDKKKSTVKTAHLLAPKQKVWLSMRYLDVVFDVRKEGSQLLRTPSEGDRNISLKAYLSRLASGEDDGP